MKLSIDGKKLLLTDLLLYILGFFLIIEWLLPLKQLTDTQNITVFILFLGLSLLLAYFRVPGMISGTLKSIFILYSLVYLFFEGSFFTFSWIQPFIASLIENVALVFDTNWPDLTSMFKSLLFFILLWLMAYLIDYWLIKRRKIFTFFLLTIVYITILDTFTLYSAQNAIIRTVIIGFITMGMLTFLRLKEKEGLANNSTYLFKWMLPLVVFIIVSAGIGYITPKADPIWPDPVPFIQTMGDKGGEEEVGTQGGVHRVGYSVDDSRLGGEFIGDDTLVFETEVEKGHYWKVETKDTYTGKGWVQSEQSLALNDESFDMLENGGEIPFRSYEEGNGVAKSSSDSKVMLREPFTYLLYPLGVKTVNAANSYLELEIGNERGIFNSDIQEYTVNYDIPSYSLEALTTADMEEFATENPEMAERYLQLPDTLSQRVRDLAEAITQNDENVFAKARSIESYFSSNGFVYSQNNVAVPEEDQDYVDQFLFETMIGYCDNFSTSMVTLLRSIDIPARWVKGFTEGELKEVDGDKRYYEVTNNNAHSWVEAYFPGVGWVAFEPTQGFSNANTYLNDVQNESNSSENAESETEQEQQQAQEQENPEQAEEEKQAVNENSAISTWWNQLIASIKSHWQWITGIAVGIMLLASIIYKYRYKWLPYYYLWKYRKESQATNFPKAYLILMHLLEIAGLGKKDDITLREYAKQIDYIYGSNEMALLTAKYEEYLYRGKLKEDAWMELKELWENLIKKTTA